MKYNKPTLKHLHRAYYLLLISILGLSSLESAPLNQSHLRSDMGNIAYINEYQGKDAVFIMDAVGENVIFTCNYENEIILTPSVSSDGRYITFLVDNGRDQKVIHILGPVEKTGEKWQAPDLTLLTIRGGAWPIVRDETSVYISMPDQTALTLSGSSNIYLVSAEEIKQITNNMGNTTHIWPVLSPDGKKILYRSIPRVSTSDNISEPVKSVLLDLETGQEEAHFIDQNIYMEQWTDAGDLLFSFKELDQNGYRIYALYNPVTRETREVYRNNSRQGSLSKESRFLATIRPFPAGGADFDIFVKDLNSQQELNLTQTPKQSESLIGWIK